MSETKVDLLLLSNLVIMRHLNSLAVSADLRTMIREIELLRSSEAIEDFRRSVDPRPSILISTTLAEEIASG